MKIKWPGRNTFYFEEVNENLISIETSSLSVMNNMFNYMIDTFGNYELKRDEFSMEYIFKDTILLISGKLSYVEFEFTYIIEGSIENIQKIKQYIMDKRERI